MLRFLHQLLVQLLAEPSTWKGMFVLFASCTRRIIKQFWQYSIMGNLYVTCSVLCCQPVTLRNFSAPALYVLFLGHNLVTARVVAEATPFPRRVLLLVPLLGHQRCGYDHVASIGLPPSLPFSPLEVRQMRDNCFYLYL